MRSLLFVPGDSERKLAKGLDSGADALILDLEDSVAAEAKPRAREIAAAFLAGRQTGTARLFVRINDLASGLSDLDLAAVMPGGPAGIVLPKACGRADVELLSAKLRVLEAANGAPDAATRVVAIATETPASVLYCADYRAAGPRLVALTWGAEDLSAVLGAHASRDEQGGLTGSFGLARSVALMAAAAADVAAIDTAFTDLRDLERLGAECGEAERDGFTGKLAIHPAQVPVINEAFTPQLAAVKEAEAVVAAFAAVGNAGVIAHQGRMLDRPHLRRAERLIARARGAAS